MKFVLFVLVSAVLISCGKSNKSGKAMPARTVNPLEVAAICQGPAQVFGVQGKWSDYTAGVDSYVDLEFENSGRLVVSHGCLAPDGRFATDTGTTRYMVSANEISVNNMSPIEVYTGGENCELENFGGQYTFYIQGECLVMSGPLATTFYARVIE